MRDHEPHSWSPEPMHLSQELQESALPEDREQTSRNGQKPDTSTSAESTDVMSPYKTRSGREIKKPLRFQE